MKKTLSLIVLTVLVALVLMAASPTEPPIQYIRGPLGWTRASSCGVSDYMHTQAMTKLYLTGNFKPTHGLMQGCQVSAKGNYYRLGACEYFQVDLAQVTCASDSVSVFSAPAFPTR